MKGKAVAYMPEELAWIQARADWPRARLHSAFCFMFDRTDVTEDHIKSLCRRKGWKRPDDWRRTKRGPVTFTAEQIEWLHANRTLSRSEAHAAFVTAFPGTTITKGQIVSWRSRNRVTTGRDARFKKGNPSHNKGRKGYCAPGSEKGHFRKGTAPPNRVPLWSERIGRDGYIEMKVPQRNPWTGHATRFYHKHRWLWEQANGPVPADHALKCLDGNRLNTDPSNWECIPRALLPRLNNRHGRNYDAAPAEVKPTLMLIAKVEHQTATVRSRKGNDR